MTARRGWAILLGILGLVAAGRIVHLGVFMVDAGASDFAVSPRLREVEGSALKPFFPRHCCLTAYVIAAQAAAEGDENLYRSELYDEENRGGRVREEIGDTFSIDSYQYPPPFLLLPWILERVGGGFFGARTIFFFLNVGVFLVCLVALARWIRASTGLDDGTGGLRVWMALPLVLGTNTTLASLQVSNVHLLVVMVSFLGMLAAAHGRNKLAGALLGFVTLVKVFPGILLVFLLARGKTKAVLWAAVFGAGYLLATLAVFGTQPFAAFFGHQLGALTSGKAFDFGFTMAAPMLQNTSMQGLPFKLGYFGLLENPAPIGRALTWIYGLVLLGLALWSGRRTRTGRLDEGRLGPLAEPALWVAFLVLAQMRSPFIPWFYWTFAVLWLVTLWLAMVRTWPARGCLAITWLVLATPLPLPFGPRSLDIDSLVSVLGACTALGLAAATIAIVRSPSRAEGLANRAPPGSALAQEARPCKEGMPAQDPGLPQAR